MSSTTPRHSARSVTREEALEALGRLMVAQEGSRELYEIVAAFIERSAPEPAKALNDADKDNAVQQAQNWAQEARTQRNTVLSILRYFGLPERDWEALELIKAKVSAPDAAPHSAAVKVCPIRDAACVEVPVAARCRECLPDALRAPDAAAVDTGDQLSEFASQTTPPAGEHALVRFNRCGGNEEPDPVERLRFFCSLAMKGQDWLDVEPFFDALATTTREADASGFVPQGTPPQLLYPCNLPQYPGQWIGENGQRYILKEWPGTRGAADAAPAGEPAAKRDEWKLSNAMWRMFNHGRDGNTVSAQCEVQALGMFLRGRDIPAWSSSVIATPTRGVGSSASSLSRFPSETTGAADERATLLAEWKDAYLAFKGAFDTPLCRRNQASEYAQDARRRLRDFDEKFAALATGTAGEGGERSKP